MANEKNEYVSLIEDAMFEEAYILLKQNTQKMDDVIGRSRHIKEFFTEVFDDYVFDSILKRNETYSHLLQLSQATVQALKTDEHLKAMAPKLANFIDTNKLMIMFVFLVHAKEFDSAKFFLPYFNKNLEGFPETVVKIIDTNNVDALKFLCENMDNIHFNEGALLRLSSSMNPKAIQMLVEDFKFDINEQSVDKGYNLIHTLVSEKNIKNFKFVVDNYGGNINWGATITKKNRNSNINVFDMIEQLDMQLEFYTPVLDNMTLKSNYINRISDSLLKNRDIINKASETDIYHRLFSHPGFDPNVVNLDQGHFLYGILSELGKEFQRSGEAAAKPFFKILDAYIDSSTEDEIPVAVNFHIVGAAVHVASQLDSKIVTDATALVLRRYNKYINQPNPFGQLPIMQVEKDSPIYRLLINNGAIPPEPEAGFWKSMLGVFNNKKKQEMVVNEAAENIKVNANNHASNNSLITLRNQMREDFRVMRNYTSNDLCDATIKMRCENMFLKSDKLVMQMEKHGINQAYEDMFFLGENFSKYLKESLRSYIEVCEATVDFSSGSAAQSKLTEAKNKCMEQVNLLSEQLALITENIFNEVEGNAVRGQSARSRFLKNRFQSESDLGLSDIMDKNKNVVGVLQDQDNSGLSQSEIMKQTLEKSSEVAEVAPQRVDKSSAINIFETQPEDTPTRRNRM